MNRKYTFSTTLSNNRNSTNPSFYINPSINNIESFVISSFQGVNNIYTFDSRNCNILITETAQAPFTAVIPHGNYTISSLLTTLSTILTTASTTSTYTATKNDLTNIITITSDTTTFVIGDTVNNAYYELGYVVNTTTPALAQTASNQYDLSGLKTIHIVSNDLGNDGSFLVNSNYNILCSIPVDAPYLSPIHYQENSDLLINCKINELSSISFHLIDERHRTLSNVSDWSIQLITSFQ
jgi:hypothetical protein